MAISVTNYQEIITTKHVGLKKSYLGGYKITKDHIDYEDEIGFTADGRFKDEIFYHGNGIV